MTEHRKIKKRIYDARHRETVKNDPERNEKKRAAAREYWANLPQERKLAKWKQQQKYRTTETGRAKRREYSKMRSRKLYEENSTKAVAMLGGKCIRCGLIDDPIAYDFHHQDPSQKEYTIASNMSKLTWDSLKEEVEKCSLLCCICHRKLHREINGKSWRLTCL